MSFKALRLRSPGGWLAVLCLVALIGCAYQLVQNGSIDEIKAAKIEGGIQSIRGLPFKEHVPVVVETRDEAEKDLAAELHRNFTDEEFAIDGQTGALIGLYPAGIDLKQATLSLLKSQIAGFYDPHQKRMVLVSGSTDLGFWFGATAFVTQRDMVGEMLLAHELTHALQDQHFGIDKALDRLKDNDDRALALKSVAEGDATLAGFGYVAGRMDKETVELVTSRLSDLPKTFAAQAPTAPEGLTVPLIFQYSSGVRFVAEAFKRGGWKAVSALYSSPPGSCRQIENPTLYFDYPSPPAEIRLGGYQQILTGWSRVRENTIGELLLRVILKRGIGERAPQTQLAERWVGDRMVVMRSNSALSVLWYVVLSDARSSQQFAAAYTGVLDRLLGQKTAHRIDYKGNAVLIIIGSGARYFAQLAPSVWAGTAVSHPASPPPIPMRADGTPAVRVAQRSVSPEAAAISR
jgi:hypothetical protein